MRTDDDTVTISAEHVVKQADRALSSTADGAFAVDRRQRIVMWNRAATGILGHRADAVLGRHCFEVLCGRDTVGGAHCRRGCETMAAARRLDLPATMDVAARTASGDRAWLSVTSMVVPDRRRRLHLLVHLFRETTRWHEVLDAARAMVEVLNGGPPSGSGRPAHRRAIVPRTGPDLTRREREVLAHLTNGASTAGIATALCVSRRTVRNHVANILAKLGAHTRLEAVMRCIRDGLV